MRKVCGYDGIKAWEENHFTPAWMLCAWDVPVNRGCPESQPRIRSRSVIRVSATSAAYATLLQQKCLGLHVRVTLYNDGSFKSYVL